MIKIQNAFLENNYLENTPDTVFTMLINTVDPDKMIKYSKNFFIHGLLKYPLWEPNIDIFQFLKNEYLELLKNNEAYFIFDASTEGFSPIHGEPFFDLLYFNCEKYNVNPKNIIFVSSNLKDKENINLYAKEKNKTTIHIFCFTSFEYVVSMGANPENKTVFELLESEKLHSHNCYSSKYFSSLSRVNRPHRTAATFILCQDPIHENALISHDIFEHKIQNITSWKQYNMIPQYSDSDVLTWISKLPITIDQTDFSMNWALNTDFTNIHRQTLFQIVNETLVDDKYNTSLFYSEKTFRPILCFQPFVIFGQPGANYHLKELGYKTYEDWFDLSFDYIKNPIERYNALLNSVKTSCNNFKHLSKTEQIAWRYKNENVLIHNYTTMINSSLSKNNLILFLKSL